MQGVYGQDKVYLNCQIYYDMYASGKGQDKVYINCQVIYDM